MNVTFGLHLDGESGWRAANRLGMPVLGPLGFLNLLETRLGLLRAECAQPQRVIQYLECLKRCDTTDRFYHASFIVDPIEVSASLLSWRDQWYLNGWSGDVPSAAGVRIADMVEVEKIAKKSVFPSLGERLREVAEALSKSQHGLEGVALVDPAEAFPKRWRAVLQKLPIQSVRTYVPSADEQTILGKLQRALLSAREGRNPNGKIPWSDDGSLCVVRAETRLVASRWVAQALKKPGALVAEKEHSLIDATLDAVDIPRQGLQGPSPLVPALQVLRLALSTMWEPLNVHSLLKFLSHPIGPLPVYARQRLAEVVAASPGIGGPRWLQAIEEIERIYPDQAEQIRTELAVWIDHPRYRPDKGAPVTRVLERSARVRDYFAIGLSDDDVMKREISATGYRQAVAVTAALEAMAAQGETLIGPVQLEALISHCTAQGALNRTMGAQVGCAPSASEPGALIESFDKVIWWQLAAPAVPSPYPWTLCEINALERAGVGLPDPNDVLRRRSQDWIRPVLNTREQLILVLPPSGEEMHPLWQEIHWLVEGIVPRPLENLLTDQGANELSAVIPASLPRRRRWWNLPPGVKIPIRPHESYSSLNVFLNAPYQYLLKYCARLHSSALLKVTDGNQLYGNLAHRLIERFFRANDPQKLSGDTLAAWFSEQFQEVLAEEGAVLLMPGRRGDYERLRSTLECALEELCRHIRAANVDRVEPERNLVGTFAGGELKGQADLVVRNKAGRQAIVDMKWTNAKSYRERLEKNRHLQLAVYAEMLRQETFVSQDVLYFIFEGPWLFGQNTEMFPHARTVPSTIAGGTQVLWEQFVTAWKWRRSQVDAGRIEVAIDDIAPTPDSEAPDGALAPEELPATYDEYRWLVGWEV